MTAPGVLVVTVEPLGEALAGPAIRALELARALVRDGRAGTVTVASLGGVTRADDLVRLVAATDEAALRSALTGASTVLVQGDVLGLHPWLAQEDVAVVVDAYDPYHLEQLEQARPAGERARRAVVRDCVRSLSTQLSRADLVLCASPRQRDLWTGHLAALGRINPLVYDASPDLDRFVAVVPFGVSRQELPARDRTVLRSVIPDLRDDDVVLVWGGGIYAWFDPELLVRAVAEVRTTVPSVRLLFLGTRHPVSGVSAAAAAAVAAAEEAGVLGTAVHFHDGWVPYDERGGWLRAADIGVSTHHDHLETRYSFRTRLLDYLWAGLPVVTTAGDDLGAEMVGRGAALVVTPGSSASLVEALERAVTDAVWRRSAAQAARDMAMELTWDDVVRPLAEFCAAPVGAPDLSLDAVDRRQLGLAAPTPRWSGIAARVRAAGREGGWPLVGRRLVARAARLVR